MLTFDSNILIYAFDATAGNRHLAAKQIMDDALGPNSALTDQSLFEFFHASTRKGKMSVFDATSVVRELLSNYALLPAHQTVVEDTFDLMSRHLLGIWDARLLAVCNAHGCSHLLSEDMQDGAIYGGITVINPFNRSNAAIVARALNQ